MPPLLARANQSAGTARVGLVVAVPAFLALAWCFDFLVDDAFISFRYARNFAEGNGLRFNPTTGVPVEGYTNLLWVLVLAGLYSLGLDILLWSRLLSVVCGVGLLVAVARVIAAHVRLDAAVLALVFLATLPAMAVWATGGLAVVPMAAALFMGFERLVGDRERAKPVQAGLSLLVAALLRADGAIFAGVLVAAVAVAAHAARHLALRRAALIAAAWLCAGVALYIAWRVHYHGDWLPNTARLRGGLSLLSLERGAKYVISQFFSMPGLIVVVLAAPLIGSRLPAIIALPVLAVIAADLVYTSAVGGDWMPMGRFVVPALGFAAVGMAGALDGLAAQSRAAAWCVAALCIAGSFATLADRSPIPDSWWTRFHYQWNHDEPQSPFHEWLAEGNRASNWSNAGRLLGRYARPGDSIVLDVIGAVGWYAPQLHIYDTYGLVTPEVLGAASEPVRRSAAHDRKVHESHFWQDRPIERRPTILGSALAPSRVSCDTSALGLAGHALFPLLEVERHPLEPTAPVPNIEKPAVQAQLREGMDLCLIRIDWRRTRSGER